MDLPDLSVSTLARDRDGTCAVVTLAGRARIADGAWFRQLLELPEAHESGHIILDLSRLSSIDWWAALILLWVGRMVSRGGGTLVLASPQPAVARLLTTAGAAQARTYPVPLTYGFLALMTTTPSAIRWMSRAHDAVNTDHCWPSASRWLVVSPCRQSARTPLSSRSRWSTPIARAPLTAAGIDG